MLLSNDYSFLGKKMHGWATELFPICRSVTGNGLRETLAYIQAHIPALEVHSIKSGTDVFDWTVPLEWEIKDAYIITPSGEKIADFKENNLHVVGYSEPIEIELSLEELQKHLYSLPQKPSAIPYVTSYYKKRWGFCLSHLEREKLVPGKYKAVIKSRLFSGKLDYGEVFIPGQSTQEILISTYICHPSMANNELSGPVVTMALIKQIEKMENRFYSYRFVFVPETIGAICFLAKSYKHLKQNVIAGYVLTCIGDDRNYSYLSSREENTLSDRVAIHLMKHHCPEFKLFSFLDRGSDERQYCSPGIDLPIGSIMRTKYGEYPEYHTSLDDLTLVTPTGLAGGLEIVSNAISLLESNRVYRTTVMCEPQLGKRGLYPTLSDMSADYTDVRVLINFLAYCDGCNDLIAIADKIKVNALSLVGIVNKLLDVGLIIEVLEEDRENE